MLHPPCCSDYNPDSVPHFWNPTGAPLHPSISHDEQDLSRQDTYTVGHVDNVDQLQRHLGNRQVQLIAIGGSIGTATFVSIANGLIKGGPGSLFPRLHHLHLHDWSRP